MSQEEVFEKLRELRPEQIPGFLATLKEDPKTVMAMAERLFDWESSMARPSQIEPGGIWRFWMIKAGRGFGKTRTGAEVTLKKIRSGKARRSALIGRTASDVRDVLVEGPSGIIACSPPWDYPKYEPSKRRITFTAKKSSPSYNATITTYTADEPDILRGPEHDWGWCDELAAWKYPDAWDNFDFGLRLGKAPKAVITTTPRPTRLVRSLVSDPDCVVTGGSTYENLKNLPPAFIRRLQKKYEGTGKGRQEIHGEVMEEAEGALWRRHWIDVGRVSILPDMDKCVVAIDPAVSATDGSNETGIVVVGMNSIKNEKKGWNEEHFYVLHDASGRLSPAEWARRAVRIYEFFDADCIIGEANNGGDLVEANLRTIDRGIPFRKVWASRGKAPRAEPVASMYEQGRCHHYQESDLADLEDSLVMWEPGTGMDSPDRLDALVWAIRYMMPEGRAMDFKPMEFGELDRTSYWRN